MRRVTADVSDDCGSSSGDGEREHDATEYARFTCECARTRTRRSVLRSTFRETAAASDGKRATANEQRSVSKVFE